MSTSLISSEEPLASPTTDEERVFVDALSEALHGGLERDTVSNTGHPFDDHAIRSSRATFNEFLDSALFRELQAV